MPRHDLHELIAEPVAREASSDVNGGIIRKLKQRGVISNRSHEKARTS